MNILFLIVLNFAICFLILYILDKGDYWFEEKEETQKKNKKDNEDDFTYELYNIKANFDKSSKISHYYNVNIIWTIKLQRSFYKNLKKHLQDFVILWELMDKEKLKDKKLFYIKYNNLFDKLNSYFVYSYTSEGIVLDVLYHHKNYKNHKKELELINRFLEDFNKQVLEDIEK